MSSLQQSSTDIMIPYHEYNQLTAIRDDYILQGQQLQKQKQRYEFLERDFAKLFQQKKELEKDVKNISAISIGLSLKMFIKYQEYFKDTKEKENEMKVKQQNFVQLIKQKEDEMIEKQKNYLEQIQRYESEMNEKQKNYLQQINRYENQQINLQDQCQKIKQQLRNKEADHLKYLKVEEQLNQIIQNSLLQISADNTMQKGLLHNSKQMGTQKIQLSQKKQQSNLSLTDPPEKDPAKQVQNKVHPLFTSSLSSIHSKTLNNLNKLTMKLQAAKKKIAEYESNSQSFQQNALQSRQSSITTNVQQNLSSAAVMEKYMKYKILYNSTKEQLKKSQMKLKKLEEICKAIKSI